MARTKGMLNLSGNLEVNAQAPLDARTIVPTEADLTVANNFPYPYIGLEVYVTGTGKKFRLVNLDTTQSSSWHEVGEGGGGSGLPSGGTAGQYLVKQSATEGDADWQSLNAFTGATSQAAGAAGLVPAPAIGDEGKVLFGNGSWGNIVMPSVDLSNSSVESDILDTTEKAVGTTTDGYLIYQKVVSTGGSVPSGATLLMRVQLQNSTDIIRYTKTTDSPLASDEKFAGVTSGGEVIYEKTVETTSPSSANTWTVIADLGVNNVIYEAVGTIYPVSGSIGARSISFRDEIAYSMNYSKNGELALFVDSGEYTNKPVTVKIRYTKTS